MAVYLGKTHEKVDALVRAAVMEGVEGNRVVVVSGCFPSSFCDTSLRLRFLIYAVIQAMKPLMDAVEHALAFHRARSAAVGSGVTLEKPGGLKLI
jgi:transcription initiation factor TFIIH subunit 1